VGIVRGISERRELFKGGIEQQGNRPSK